MKFILSLLFIVFTATTVFSQPKLEFINGNVHEWGEIPQSQGPLTTKIQIKNIGNEELEIFGVKPGCGCTTAPIDKDELKPGEIATVDVILRINKDEGPITKTIEFTTNDPENDRITYFLKANVIVPLTLFPDFINLGGFFKDETREGKIVLSNNTKKPITITKVTTFPSSMRVNISKGKVLAPGSNTAVKATAENADVGTYLGKITILTDNEEQPSIEIKVNGQVSPR